MVVQEQQCTVSWRKPMSRGGEGGEDAGHSCSFPFFPRSLYLPSNSKLKYIRQLQRTPWMGFLGTLAWERPRDTEVAWRKSEGTLGWWLR